MLSTGINSKSQKINIITLIFANYPPISYPDYLYLIYNCLYRDVIYMLAVCLMLHVRVIILLRLNRLFYHLTLRIAVSCALLKLLKNI